MKNNRTTALAPFGGEGGERSEGAHGKLREPGEAVSGLPEQASYGLATVIEVRFVSRALHVRVCRRRLLRREMRPRPQRVAQGSFCNPAAFPFHSALCTSGRDSGVHSARIAWRRR
jgi:hypothetical protein